ncbi:MAG: phosphatase PAP2 family protein [Acidobacteria bacterium]|nr:phosphatase PAP2 family protein [Acidobacteriota bacterium]
MSVPIRGVLTSIEAFDHYLMRKVHGWPAPRWIRWWMLGATRGGDGWLWAVLGVAIAIYGGPRGTLAALQSTLAVGAGIVLFLGLKRLAGRRRPCAIAPHCWSTLLPPDQFSFPSGHTITAFAAVVPLGAAFPEAAPGLYLCATSIGISRILLGMHFLSDVVAGAALGGALGRLLLSCS